MSIYQSWGKSSGRKLSDRRRAKRRGVAFLWMRNQSAHMLEFGIGNRAIITNRWVYLPESSRSCFNAQGFREVIEQAGRWLSPTRRLSGWPHFLFPANLPLVDVPRK